MSGKGFNRIKPHNRVDYGALTLCDDRSKYNRSPIGVGLTAPYLFYSNMTEA